MINLDKKALKEAMVDTFTGTLINLPLVWLVDITSTGKRLNDSGYH